MVISKFSRLTMKININSKVLFIIFNIISLCSLFLLLYKNIPFVFGNSFNEFVYNSDYFINYTSGLIKRGLDGQIIYHITLLTGFSPVNILRVMYLTFFVILSGIVLNIWLRSKVSLYFIISPFLFIFPFVYFPLFHIAKDMEVLILSYIVLFLFINKKSKWLLNIVLSIGILVHEEIFIFLFFPLLLLHLFYFSEGRFLEKIKSFCITLFPSAALFLLMILKYNGLSNNINIIIDSWKTHSSYLQNVSFNSGLFDGKPRLINETIYAPYNILGFGLLIIINFIFITSGIYLYSRRHFIVLFVISALQILPTIILCFMASDFGRWFYIPNVLILFSMFLLRDKERSQNFNWRSIDLILKRYDTMAPLAIGFFYIFGGMPYIGFNIYRYFYSNPLSIIFNWVK